MKPNARKPILLQIMLSFRFAFAGLRLLLVDRNMLVHLAAAIVVIALGVWLHLAAMEWAILALTIGLVLSLEAINSAIEFAVDLASPEYHELAKRAKDVSAAAVLMAAMTAIVVGAFLFLPHLRGG